MDLRLPPSLLGISKRNFRFVFQASRCLIYKVQKFFCSPLFRECLFILPDLVSFVKLFFNFFRSFSCSESLNLNFSKLFVRFRWPTGQLIYNTTSASPCQQVFSSFVNFIRKRFKKPVRRSACGGPPSQAALLGYHFQEILSIPFAQKLSLVFVHPIHYSSHLCSDIPHDNPQQAREPCRLLRIDNHTAQFWPDRLDSFKRTAREINPCKRRLEEVYS